MTTIEPTVRATRYVVSVLPEDFHDAYNFDVVVEYRGPMEVGGDPDRWAVMSHIGSCLSDDGTWDYEPSPSNRTDGWKQRHRFPLEKALELAKQAAPDVVVNGMTPAQAYARFGPGSVDGQPVVGTA